MHTLAEERFVNKLKGNRREGQPWFTLERAQFDPEKVKVIDKLFIKGLGTKRDANYPQMDYTKVSSMESFGIRQYVHKYDQGMQDYYYY